MGKDRIQLIFSEIRPQKEGDWPEVQTRVRLLSGEEHMGGAVILAECARLASERYSVSDIRKGGDIAAGE